MFFTIVVINGFFLCAIQIFAAHHLKNKDPTALTLLILCIFFELVFTFSIVRQPKNKKLLYFEVRYSIGFMHIIVIFS